MQDDCQKAFKKLNLQDFCYKCSFFNSFTQTPPLNCQNSPGVIKGKGLIPEELQSWGLETWNFHGYWNSRMLKFRWLIKKETNFHGWLWVFVFGFAISNGCNTVLLNKNFQFQFWGFLFSKIHGFVGKLLTQYLPKL